MKNNTVMYDEVLSHRLGLIPIKADPRLFDWDSGDEPTDLNTMVFTLKVDKSNPPALSSNAPAVSASNRLSTSGSKTLSVFKVTHFRFFHPLLCLVPKESKETTSPY